MAVLVCCSRDGSSQIASKATLVMQLGHSSGVNSIAVSRDGMYIATGSDDRTVALWEAGSGRQLRQISGHADAVRAVAFSPDGKYIATGSDDRTSRLWDAATGNQMRRFEGHTGAVLAVAFSPDGLRLLTAGVDHTARLWDVATGNQVRSFAGHTDSIVAASFSTDGKQILTGSKDKSARLWDVATGQEIRRFTRQEPLTSAALSGNGRHVLLGSNSYPAILFDASSGAELRRFGVPVGPCALVAFSPDGQRVLTGGPFAIAALWDTSTGQQLKSFTIHTEIRSIAFLPDGRQVITGDAQTITRIWDVASASELQHFVGGASAVTTAVFSPRGNLMVTALADHTARIWDRDAGKETGTIEGNTNTVSSVVFSTDSTRFLTGSYDGSTRLWDTASGKQVVRMEVPSAAAGPFGGSMFSYVFSVAISRDGKRAVSGGLDNTMHLWDLESGKELHRFEGHSDGVWTVDLSPDGRLAASGSFDKTARVWDVQSGSTLQKFEGSFAGALAVRFMPDGHQLIASGADNTVRVWDLTNGHELHRLKGHSDPVQAIAVSTDGRYVLTGSQDSTARLWDLEHDRELCKFEGHTNTVASVDFSPDGRFVLTGSSDSSIRLWDRNSGKQLATIAEFAGGGWAVVDPDGRFDTTALDGGAPLHWVLSEEPMRTLPLEIFMRDYYTPGLLARVVKGETLPPVRPIAEIKNRVQPYVAIVSVTPSAMMPGRMDVVVHAVSHTDEKGVKSGLQDLRLFRDGQMVGSGFVDVPTAADKVRRVTAGYIEGPLPDGDYTFRDVMLKSSGQKVTFTAYAFNSERIKSATATLEYQPKTSVANAVKPKAYLLQIGVNHYAADSCELNYSANDAEKLNVALAARLSKNYEPVSVKLKSAGGGNTWAAGKQAIRNQLAAIAAKATPDDVFFMSFSGHGYSAPRGDFYILPSDTQGSCRRVDDALLKTAISADELADWLRPIDAGEMTLILDACYSAESVQAGDFKPGPMGSRGLGQLAYDKRMRVLAASQSDEVAHEYDYLQQGLLTYVLTHDGLDEGKADWKPVDKKITVGEWLSYGAGAVPKFVPPDKLKISVSKAAGNRFGDDTPNGSIQIPALFDFSKTDTLQLQ
jgi:WD40 repeat protein